MKKPLSTLLLIFVIFLCMAGCGKEVPDGYYVGVYHQGEPPCQGLINILKTTGNGIPEGASVNVDDHAWEITDGATVWFKVLTFEKDDLNHSHECARGAYNGNVTAIIEK